jgi:hypothetical protein
MNNVYIAGTGMTQFSRHLENDSATATIAILAK